MERTASTVSRRDFLQKAAVFATGSAGLLLLGCESPRQNPQRSTELPFRPLPEFTEADLNRIAKFALEDYAKMGASIDKESALSSFLFVPNLSKLIPEQKDQFCSLMPCQDEYLGGYTNHTVNKIFIPKDGIDIITKDAPDSGQNRYLRDAFVRISSVHELTHWNVLKYSPSDELYFLTVNYFSKHNPEIEDPSKFERYRVTGATVNGRGIDQDNFFTAFRGLEEAEAELISKYAVGETIQRATFPYMAIDYKEHKALLADLLKSVNPNYAESIKTLARLRTQEYGREDFMRLVGSKFETNPEKHLETGFNILAAITENNRNLYKSLTATRIQP